MDEAKFVYIEVFGGLGNQLFQYAAGYTVSKIYSCKIYIKNDNNNPHNIKEHNYVQKLFLDASECSSAPGAFNQYNQLYSPFFPWNPVEAEPSCRLGGYFQYYPAIQPFLPTLVDRLSEALAITERTNDVFIHIRRGDYVEKSNYHYLQGPDYYVKAYLQLINDIGKIPERVVLFSDDINWCKQQEWIRMIPNLIFYENDDELDNLREMAKCSGGAIIANSTFSWWGAMLSKNQFVYYPSKWIGSELYDLFPKYWVCI